MSRFKQYMTLIQEVLDKKPKIDDKLIESGGVFKGMDGKQYSVIKDGENYSIKKGKTTYGPLKKESIMQIVQKIKNEQTSEIEWKSLVEPSNK